MRKVHHPSETRGKADYGWLKANYSFSFANFFNPDRTQFGLLRVLNDDEIAPAKGFGTHPHDNMEIVSIPLSGALAHKDSMSHEEIIKAGDIQVMSAGSGVTHSEYNPSESESTNLLQLWVFPEKRNVEPRYDQKTFDLSANKNSLIPIVSPKNNHIDGSLWLHQQTYFSLGEFEESKQVNYQLKKQNHGAYIFVIEGSITCENQILNDRDALGIWDTKDITLTTNAESKLLIIEVPMN